MKKRNEYLAEVADVVIAYSGRERSGSAQTIRMAEKLGKRVFNLFGKH
jgi:predicted Rossmann fold nucleotide-binding protein DprA/Smf involved in DNA uptake